MSNQNAVSTPPPFSPATVCPICKHDDQIKKVSSIVSAGTSIHRFEGNSVDVAGASSNNGVSATGLGVGSMSGVQLSQSHLSATLDGPVDPRVAISKKTIVWLAIFVIALVRGLVGWKFINAEMGITERGVPKTLFDFIFGFGVFVLGPLVVVFVVKLLKSIHKRKVGLDKYPAYVKALEKWSRLYYCGRDDVVFDPATGASVPIDKCDEFIYQN